MALGNYNRPGVLIDLIHALPVASGPCPRLGDEGIMAPPLLTRSCYLPDKHDSYTLDQIWGRLPSAL